MKFLAFGGVGLNKFIAFKTLHVCLDSPSKWFIDTNVIQFILLSEKQSCKLSPQGEYNAHFKQVCRQLKLLSLGWQGWLVGFLVV